MLCFLRIFADYAPSVAEFGMRSYNNLDFALSDAR